MDDLPPQPSTDAGSAPAAGQPPQWTEDGRVELGIVLRRAFRSQPRATEAERAELTRAITRRLESEGAGPIDADAVRRAGRHIVRAWNQRVRSTRGRDSLGPVLALCVVVLPLLVLAVELLTHMCGTSFFDPIPTWWHVASVLSVPLAGYVAHLQLRAGTNARPGPWIGALFGFACVTTTVYGVLFVPLMPISLLLVLAVVGWLGMAPVFAAVAFPIVLVRVAGLAHDPRFRRGAWTGAAACIVLHVAVAAPMLLTAAHVHAAATGSPEEIPAAIAWLREHGDEATLARHASGAPVRIGPFGAYSSWTWLEEGRDATLANPHDSLWFRIHGSRYADPMRSSIGLADVGFGAERLVAPVGLRASRLAGDVLPDVGVARLAWTIEFALPDDEFRPMRVLLDLPDAAVVTAARWWDEDGWIEADLQPMAAHARERGFGGQPRILVTSAGDDRVAVQVERNAAGRARFELSVVVPLAPDDGGASVRLPRFAIRSTEPAPDLHHEIAFASRHDLTIEGLAARTAGDGLVVVEGRLPARALDPSAPAYFARTTHRSPSVLAYATGTDVAVVRRRTTGAPIVPPVVVVDGSASNAPYARTIQAALRAAGVALVFVSVDAGYERLEGASAVALDGRIRFVGGQDPRPALLEAFDAAHARDADVVWITGPTILWPGPDVLHERLARGGDVPRIVCVQTVPGPNELRAAGAAALTIENVDVARGLEPVLAEVLGSAPRHELEFSRATFVPEAAARGPEELATLVAGAELARIARIEGFGAAWELRPRVEGITLFQGAVVEPRRWDAPMSDLLPVRVLELAPTTVADRTSWGGTLVSVAFLALIALAHARRPRHDPAP